MPQVGRRRRNERHHGAKQNRARQYFGPKQQDRRRDVRAVGTPDRRHSAWIEFVTHRGRANEIGQLIRAPDDIGFIEDALGQAPEESRPAILQNIPARTEQRRFGIKLASEREHVVFIATGPVEEQENMRRRACLGWNKVMREIHILIEERDSILTRCISGESAQRRIGFASEARI